MAKKNDDDKNKDDVMVADDAVEDAQVDDVMGDVEAEEVDIEKLKEEFLAMQNQLKRAVADYQNLEKRVAEGRTEWAQWAGSELIQKILPSVDHLEKALAGASDEERKSGWLKGVEMSVKQLKEILKSEGLEQIGADGQFDPALHEAVDIRDGEHDKILEVVDSGYMLNGKVLRPARVVVGRKQ